MRFSLWQFSGTVASGTAASTASITAINVTGAGAAAVAAAATGVVATGGDVAVTRAGRMGITLAPPERSPIRLFHLRRLSGGGVDVVSYSARVYPCHVKVVIVIRRRILPTSTWT